MQDIEDLLAWMEKSDNPSVFQAYHMMIRHGHRAAAGILLALLQTLAIQIENLETLLKTEINNRSSSPYSGYQRGYQDEQ